MVACHAVAGGAKLKYPLEALLTTRRHALEAAKRQLAEALADLEAARERKVRAEAEVAEALSAVERHRERMRSPKGSASVATFRAALARLDWLKARVDERRDLLARREAEVRDAEGRYQEARARLAKARQELEVLERHREAWQREVARRREAAEEEAAEEITAASLASRSQEDD